MPAPPPRVHLRLPTVLEPIAGCTHLEVHGHTIAEALESAFTQVPTLRPHLTQDTGTLRPHILCLLNGRSLPRTHLPETPLTEGDEILIHQAISGG